jgi:hypothetical protein
MATGERGSPGENAPPPVRAERELESNSVITHRLATRAASAQETPPRCPGVTAKRVQVWCVFVCAWPGMCVRVFGMCVPVCALSLFSLPGGPQKARGSIIGNINNVEFGIAILNATISDNQSGGRVIHATISNVPRSLG